jgi:hypothetical protein
MDRSDKYITLFNPIPPEQVDRMEEESEVKERLFSQIKDAIATLGELTVKTEEEVSEAGTPLSLSGDLRHLDRIHKNLWEAKYMVAGTLHRDMDLHLDDTDPQCGRCGKGTTYELGDARIWIDQDEEGEMSAVLCVDCEEELVARDDTDKLYYIEPPEFSSVEREGVVSKPVVAFPLTCDYHRHKDTWARDDLHPGEGWEKTLHLYGSMERAKETNEGKTLVRVNKEELRKLCEEEGMTLIWYMADGEHGQIFEVQSVEYILERMGA